MPMFSVYGMYKLDTAYTSIVCLTVSTGFKTKDKCVNVVSHYLEYANVVEIFLSVVVYSLFMI